MTGWHRVTLVGAGGELRAPGRVAAELGDTGAGAGIVLTGHRFGTIPSYARLLCRHLAGLGRPWAVEAALGIAAEPDPLAGDDAARAAAARALRRIRRAGLRTVLHLVVGRPGDDAGVYARAVPRGG